MSRERRLSLIGASCAAGVAVIVAAVVLGRRDEGGPGAVVRVKKSRFVSSFKKLGTLQPLEEFRITSRTRGVITTMWPEGKPVKKGDVVLVLDSRNLERKIASQEAEVLIKKAEVVRARMRACKRVKSAEMAAKKAWLNREWKRLNQSLVNAGPSIDAAVSAENELKSAELIHQNREEELSILEFLASKGFATSDELDQKRLQVIEARLEEEKARIAREELLKGPSELEREAARLEVKIAECDLDSARKELESIKAVTRAEIEHERLNAEREEEELRREKKDLKDYKVHSPADGYILYGRHRWRGKWSVGKRIWRGAKVMSVPCVGRVKVKTVVEQSQIDNVRPGMNCRITAPAVPGASFEGKVVSIGKEGKDEFEALDRHTRRKVGKAGRQVFDVEVELLGETTDLRPGMRAWVEFVISEMDDVAVVPRGVVQATEEGEFVRVLRRGRVFAKPVRVVSSNHTHLAVEGLDDGEVVVLAGAE